VKRIARVKCPPALIQFDLLSRVITMMFLYDENNPIERVRFGFMCRHARIFSLRRGTARLINSEGE
jgi:hypothetical protein